MGAGGFPILKGDTRQCKCNGRMCEVCHNINSIKIGESWILYLDNGANQKKWWQFWKN